MLVAGVALGQTVPSEVEGEVVVRGRVPPRSASETTIEASRYRAVPRTSAAEFLSLAPGFFLSQHGGEGKAHQLYLRGFDAQHGQDVEFSVGGLPVNEVSNVHGQGYSDLNFVIPEVIDRIRVQEGPFDPHQGDFAVAGSARFDLGVDERESMVRGSYGMFNTQRLVAVVAPPGTRRETFAAGELYRTDGYGLNRAASRATAMAQYVRPFGPGATVRLLAGSYATRFSSPGVVREDDFEAGRQGFFGSYDTDQGGASGRHFLVGELAFQEGRARTSLTAHASLRSLTIRENFTGAFLDMRGDRYEQRHDATTVGLTASHRVGFTLFGRAQAWEVGLSARHDDVLSTMARLRSDGGGAYLNVVNADILATDIALYGDLELRPLPRVTLRGGVRADMLWYDLDDHLPRAGSTTPRGRRSAQGLAVGPRATVDVDLGRGVNVMLAYGRGFRSPQALTLGDGEQAPFARVNAGELGVRWRRARFNVAVAGFLTHVDRDLVFDPPSGQNLVSESSAATTRVGGSVAVQASPVRGLEMSVSGTLARASYDATGLLVPYVPPLVGRVDVSWTRPVGTVRGRPLILSAALGATALGKRPLPFSQFSDPLLVIDAALSARIARVEIGLAARNLTDARWRDGTFYYASYFDTGSPRSLIPVEHFTAGRPFALLSTVTVHL